MLQTSKQGGKRTVSSANYIGVTPNTWVPKQGGSLFEFPSLL